MLVNMERIAESHPLIFSYAKFFRFAYIVDVFSHTHELHIHLIYDMNILEALASIVILRRCVFS